MSSFKDKVRNENIKQPTHRGFELEVWKEKWYEETNKSESDTSLFAAGTVIYEILNEIRVSLTELYKTPPNITNEKLLQTFVAKSNRNRAILTKMDPSTYKNFHSATTKTVGGNNITFQEVADNCVDGYQNAIYNCVRRIIKGEALKKTERPASTLEFSAKEARLSELYSAYESYWRSLLWGDFSFKVLDEDEKLYAIVQNRSQQQIDAEYSKIRKQKIAAQSTMAAPHVPMIKRFTDDKYISVKKSGRKQRFSSKRVDQGTIDVKQINSYWRMEELLLEEVFPAVTLKKTIRNGFNVIQILNVFRQLVILSWQLTDKYPDNDGITNAKQLQQFCPRINRLDLTKALTKSTNYSFGTTNRILHFLEYSGEPEQDLSLIHI